jgi:hypothetical protein
MTDPIDKDHLSGLPNLGRRLSRKIETRKGVQLSPADLDLLVLSGAYETLCAAIGAYQKAQSAQRVSQAKTTAQASASNPLEHNAAAAAALATARRLKAPRSKREDVAYIAHRTKGA